ncbi:disease resistance protein PIK6-NP-like isoform X2 [Miscanthus floridulus]|uniref:disease resistance protein PIK6-NP-like isoform X2 n=1 Tax=Miscanthus floridulus TaxID=154761 RepID=UPI00345AE6CE
MAGMVVSAATGVLSSLLSELSDLLTDLYKQRKGVRRDIEFLCSELTDMNGALEKLAGREKLDIQTKVWRDKVREMAYDIEDSVDIFMHKLGQEDDDKDGLFHKISRKVRELRLHYQLANKIQELRAPVEEQSQCRDRYRIDESIPESRVVEVDPRLPAMFEDAKRLLVGIDGPREEIIKQLMEEDDSESGRLKVLPIVGFGGLGKTTLANQVYAKIKNEFECTAFVSVSRTPHMPKILKDILSRVGYGGTEMEDDVQKLIEILRARLTTIRGTLS